MPDAFKQTIEHNPACMFCKWLDWEEPWQPCAICKRRYKDLYEASDREDNPKT